MDLDRWSLAAAVAAVAAAALVLPRAVHSDDLEVIRAVGDLGYLEIWTAPFRDLYFRPLTSTIARVGLDTIGANLLLRVAGALLIVASLWVFAGAVRTLAGPARLTGALCLIAAPFTTVAVAPFGVGVGDSIVGLALLVCIRDRERSGWISLVAVAAALAAKESGLVVAAYVAAESLRRRRLGVLAAAIGLAGGYLIAHALLIESRAYILKTGYLFDMLSVAQQEARFGADPLVLRIYTAAANFVSALIYLPYKGQLRLSPAIVGFAAVIAGTTALWARYLARPKVAARLWPLACAIGSNAALGFAYARPRIMFAAYVAISVLFCRALDDLWRRGRRQTVGLALLAWLAVLASTLVRLARMP